MLATDFFTHFLDAIDRSSGGLGFLGVSLGRWLGLVGAGTLGMLLGWLSAWPVCLLLRRLRSRQPGGVWSNRFDDCLTRPIGFLIAVMVLRGSIDVFSIPEPVGGVLRKTCDVVSIAIAAVLAIRAIGIGKDYIQAILTRHVSNSGKIRSITTRLSIPARILQYLVGISGAALVLLQFRAVQQIGVSLLASAGLAGVVLGFAAQRTVSNLLAGLQLAFSESVRIGDTVVVEGEFGIVEEILLTNVVVKIWDLRRLILPVSYFIEKPFQNWTKESSEVIGPVMLYTDFTVRIDDIRQELDRILGGTNLWDGKTKNLQVTDLTADKVELRVLVSARDAGELWNLRCYVREKLLAWLQTRGVQHLPVRRVEEVNDPSRSGNGRVGAAAAHEDRHGNH